MDRNSWIINYSDDETPIHSDEVVDDDDEVFFPSTPILLDPNQMEVDDNVNGDFEVSPPSFADPAPMKSEEEGSNQPANSEPTSPVETQPPLRRSKRTCVRKFVASFKLLFTFLFQFNIMLLKSLKRRLLVERVVHKQLRKLEINLFLISNLRRERSNFVVQLVHKQQRKLEPNHRRLKMEQKILIQLVLEMVVKIEKKPEKLKTNQLVVDDENENIFIMY